MSFFIEAFAAAVSVGFIVLLAIHLNVNAKNRTSLERYSRITDLEAESARLIEANLKQKSEALDSFTRYSAELHVQREKLLREQLDLENDVAELSRKAGAKHAQTLAQYQATESRFLQEEHEKRQTLSAEYEQALKLYHELKKELALMEDPLEDISYGIYQPHFTYESTEEYKAKIELLRSQQRDVVRSGRAAQCLIEWTVNQSRSEGKRMIRLHSKLLLRAFNGECEAAIANLNWNNAERMEGRIRKAFADVNKLGDVEKISISDLYLMLKVEELRITNEFEQKRYQLREEQRHIREQIREEEKTQREIEAVVEESRTEEEKFSDAIARAKDEATRAMGARLEKLTQQIIGFEAKLDEARHKKERAMSRAQFTKSGFVYVISNIGSFGERVFKIGMTRRLEPMDRVYELSGASVPFPYDLHAMLFSDNAPGLENDLHRLFQGRRLNMINMRREFFRDVEFEEIENYIREKGISAQFLKIPEAREYRETLALRQNTAANQLEPKKIEFPPTIFPLIDAALPTKLTIESAHTKN